MKIPEHAPHTSRILPIPAPNDDASLSEVSVSIPVTSLNAAKTDCAQLYPEAKSSAALSA
jgi:hypothetical protein